MNTPGERANALIQHLGLSKNAFAQKIGVSSTVINGIVKDVHKPGSKVLDAIKREYPTVSTDWILSGDGSMISTKQEPQAFGQQVIQQLEFELSQMRELFSQQLNTKDQQIASLTRMLENVLGKPKGAPYLSQVALLCYN